MQESRAKSFALIIETAHGIENALLRSLMDHFLSQSKAIVEEQFTYKGVARFSRKLDLNRIAEQNLLLRKHDQVELVEFTQWWQNQNEQIDRQRVPKLSSGEYANFQLKALAQQDTLMGYLPSAVND